MSTVKSIEARKKLASEELTKLAHLKTKGKKAGIVYSLIAYKLGMSSQTVYNYAARGHIGDGYVIDALIQEFKNLK